MPQWTMPTHPSSPLFLFFAGRETPGTVAVPVRSGAQDEALDVEKRVMLPPLLCVLTAASPCPQGGAPRGRAPRHPGDRICHEM